jgi:hypothetical protein
LRLRPPRTTFPVADVTRRGTQRAGGVPTVRSPVVPTAAFNHVTDDGTETLSESTPSPALYASIVARDGGTPGYVWAKMALLFVKRRIGAAKRDVERNSSSTGFPGIGITAPPLVTQLLVTSDGRSAGLRRFVRGWSSGLGRAAIACPTTEDTIGVCT